MATDVCKSVNRRTLPPATGRRGHPPAHSRCLKDCNSNNSPHGKETTVSQHSQRAVDAALTSTLRIRCGAHCVRAVRIQGKPKR